MKNQGLINEVFWLRCLACLAVTLGHSIGNGYILYTDTSIYHVGAYILQIAILFAVPVFIFISELLLANKYINKVPKGFMKKRVKILLLPYLFMSTVYALLNLETWTLQGLITGWIGSILLGKSAVYFILIIFQFYFLHMLFSKYLNRISPKIMIPLAFVINILYLAFFNFIEAPNNAIANYIWDIGYWLPFIGWIFYFVLGFYCGRDYQRFLSLIKSKWLLIMPILTLGFMLLMNKWFLLDYDSKRVDMLLYATSIIFLIIYLSSNIVKKVPKLVMFISNYSFSIFLLNMFFLILLRNIKQPAFLNIVSFSFSIFLLTLFLCISTAYLFNRFPRGKYFVGKIMEFKVEQTEQNI